MPKEVKITWLDKPEAHDYPAALSYLTLLQDENTARRLVGRLKKAPPSRFKAKAKTMIEWIYEQSKFRNLDSWIMGDARNRAARELGLGAGGSAGEQFDQPTMWRWAPSVRAAAYSAVRPEETHLHRVVCDSRSPVWRFFQVPLGRERDDR